MIRFSVRYFGPNTSLLGELRKERKNKATSNFVISCYSIYVFFRYDIYLESQVAYFEGSLLLVLGVKVKLPKKIGHLAFEDVPGRCIEIYCID